MSAADIVREFGRRGGGRDDTAEGNKGGPTARRRGHVRPGEAKSVQNMFVQFNSQNTTLTRLHGVHTGMMHGPKMCSDMGGEGAPPPALFLR